jgi:CusS-like sensor protein
MSTRDQPPTGTRASARHSLTWRLTFILSLVIVAVMLVFGWTAERQVQQSLIQAGGDRAQAVAGQLADLLDPSVRQNRDDLRQLVARPELHRCLQDPKDTQAAEAVRALLTAPPASGLRRVELWDAAGTRLLEVIRAARLSSVRASSLTGCVEHGNNRRDQGERFERTATFRSVRENTGGGVVKQ